MSLFKQSAEFKTIKLVESRQGTIYTRLNVRHFEEDTWNMYAHIEWASKETGLMDEEIKKMDNVELTWGKLSACLEINWFYILGLVWFVFAFEYLYISINFNK